MTEPLKVWFQEGENLVPDVNENPYQFIDDNFSGCWPRLRERYVDVNLGIQLDVRIRAGLLDENARNIRLIIERAVPDFRLSATQQFDITGAIGERNCRSDLHGSRENEVPMLVYVAELIENPKRVIARLLPSVVRLHLFYDVLDSGSHLLTGADAAVHIGPNCRVNGEHALALLCPGTGMRMNETVSEVVEGRPHVVKRVSDEQRHLWRQFLRLLPVDDNQQAICWASVLLDDLTIRVRTNEVVPALFERFEVRPCVL